MVKLLHFADVHLGQTNFGYLDPATGLNSRILDFLEAMDCVAEAAEAYKPDLILFAGDAFRTRTPTPSLVTHFAERIQRMADLCPVLCVVGNHDRQKGGSGKRHSIDILASLHSTYEIIVCDSIQILQTDKACVVTLPWLYASEVSLEEICSQLDRAVEKASKDKPLILLGHCEVEGAVYNEMYSAQGTLGGKSIVYPLSFFEEGWDYVALGHVHKHQFLRKNPPVVYAGSIERVTWGERGERKVFLTAEVDVGHAEVHVHDTYARSMVQIDLPYNKNFQKLLRDYPVEDCIVRVNVTTEKPVGRALITGQVESSLQGYYLLDRIDITDLSVTERTPFQGQRFEGKGVFEMLEMYLREKYPDDDRYVDTCLEMAHKMIGEKE